MKNIEFKFEVVTPMFIGGASPNGEAELRAPSIKGMLRWWFRALGGNKDEEERIFGSTENRSKVRIRSKTNNLKIIPPKQKSFTNELAYLGYGPIGWDRETKSMRNLRPYIEVKESFGVNLNIIGQFDVEKLLLPLWAWVHFGGLGSRSRRGWGSVKVQNVPEKAKLLKWNFSNADEFNQYINKFFDQVKSYFETLSSDELPEYTRISRKTKILIGNKQHDSYEEALKEIGEKIIIFRNRKYYQDIKKLMQEAEDHNKLIRFLKPSGANVQFNTSVPKAIFGLPNNYMSRTRRGDKRRGIPTRYPWQVSVEAILGKDDITRRASPLLIKIMNWNNGKFSWVVTYMPSKFLPDRASLKLSFPPKGAKYLASKLKNKIVKANPPSYKLLEEFLKELSPISVEVTL